MVLWWGLWVFLAVGVVSTLAAEEEPTNPFISPQEHHRRLWAPNGQTSPPEEEKITLPAELLEAVRSYGRSTVHLLPNAATPPKGTTPQLAALPSSLTASEADLASLRRSPNVGRGQNINLPLNSSLQISGYKSLLLQYNKTNYFGRERLSRYYGSSLGGSRFSTGYTGFEFNSSYYDSVGYGYDYGGYGYGGYDSYGFDSFGSYGSFGGFGGGYGSYGRYSRADGINVQQELQIGIHGQVGRHTHVAVDYSDAPRAYFGGLDNKQQRIALWYEGNEESILKKAAFGDITLELPNARFLQVNRNLFGAQVIAEFGGIRLTGFGSRTKGLKGKWRSRGESRRAGAGIGQPILDTSYIRERYYAIQLGFDGRLHDGYLPIRQGSEQIFIDDNDGTNNVGGVKTARGYFNRQFPGEDYTIDYQTGRIEFLRPVTPRMTIVAAYEYLGEGGGVVGNPSNPFADDNGDGVVDEEGEPLGYVVLKASGTRGTELRNVYSLGNRNISPTEFELSIWRNGSQSYTTSNGTYSYLQIFGLDKNGDGRVDPENIDFERGLIFFPDPRPFALDAPNHPFAAYRDELANPALYAENPNPKDQVYTIQADYSYRTDEYNLGALNIIPGSEIVRVNGRQLQRDVDYQMFYDFGSISFNTRLNEFDEIEVEYEYSPFGSQLQQTVAGLWLEYEWKGKENAPLDTPPHSKSSPFMKGEDFENYSFGGYGSSFYGSYSSYGFSEYGYRGYGSSFGSSFGSYSRRTYGMIGSSYFNPQFIRGFKISAGYVLNTGQRESLIPDVNEAPSRLQAFDVNTSFGHAFELRRLVNALPLVQVDRFPLQIDFSGEAAFSHNNPNSVGYALIDGMEGARESNALPMYKYQWQVGSVPIHVPRFTNDSRVLFQHLFRDDTPSLPRNYFRNVRVSAVHVNPMVRSTEERLIAEIGYELNDIIAEWGALTYALSPEGVDFSERKSVELWVRVVGDNALTLHLDVGVFNEDADGDRRLDSEDLPSDLEDTNGDGKVDFLDLDADKLTGSQRFYGNGSLEESEDRGWEFDHPYGTATRIGQSNKILDTEDLNGDGVLDTLNAYYSITIPLDALPSEWVKKVNDSSGWTFLSVPLSAASDVGLPSWGYVKQVRLWIEKNHVGTVEGKLQIASVEFVGNEWEPGAVTTGTGKTSPDDYLRVSTKDNYNFADYLGAYRQIEDHREFRRLHPFVESAYAFGAQEQKEQTLVLAFHLEPNALGVTWKRLSGPRRGDGQDFSKHETLKMWVYGHGTGGTLLLRLSSSLRSASYYGYSSYSPYGSSRTQEPTVNVFNDLKDYYEYALPLDFTGWKQVVVPLADANRDGHPDAFRVVGNPSIESIGGVVLGVHNTESRIVEGEVWVNEIYLADPIVRSGWARRGNGRIALGSWFTVDLSYADQDKDFENSAGQTSRQYSLYQGYATSTGEYNLTARFSALRWLPLEYSLRGQESETQNRRGAISTYASGKSRTDNRTFRVQLRMPKIPELGFMFDSQKYWNERRGTEFSDLAIGSFRYGFRSLVELNAEYRHENAKVDKSTATGTSSTLGYYGYYSDNDRIVDSATFSLQLRPSRSFSFQPSYDVRRELQRRDSQTTYGASKILPFTLAEREQRFSLRPTISRSFFGIRPSVSAQANFRENWFNEKKDLSVNSNVRVGLSFRLAEVLKITPRKKPTKENEQTSPLPSSSLTVVQEASPTSVDPNQSPEASRETSSAEASVSSATESVPSTGKTLPLTSSLDLSSVSADPFFREQERLDQLSQYGFDIGQYEDYQLQRGDWINRGSLELDRSLEARRGGRRDDGFTVWQRSLNSLTFSVDYNYDVRDYLRQLDRGVSVREAMELPDEAPERSQSTQSNRVSLRASLDPLLWMSLSGDASWRNSFTKNIGTPSRQISNNAGGDVKLFNAKNTASVQIRYDYRTTDRQSVTSTYGSSVSHEGSLTWRQRWGETRTSLGTRVSLRNQERSGVTSRGVFLTPSLSVDYNLRTQSGWKMPLLRKTLKLDQNLNVTNYFTAVIRRERLGNNRDARSERYQTSLQIGYNLSQRVRANFNLSVTYNNDRIEAGQDYLSVSSALLLRGELQ